MSDDGGDRRLYYSLSVSTFCLFWMLTTGNSANVWLWSLLLLWLTGHLWQPGLLLHADCPPQKKKNPFLSTLDVCLTMFLPFCTDLFIKRNKNCVDADPTADHLTESI